MRTFGDAVSQFRGAEAGGFGVSEPQAIKTLNEAVKQFAAKSEWIRSIVDLGPAVADQARYALPDHVVKIKRLRVGQSQPYSYQDVETLWDLQAGRLRVVSGFGGVYVPEYDDTGVFRFVTIFPTPGAEEDGSEISAYCAVVPAADLGVNDSLPFPEEGFRGVLHLAKAIAYEELEENQQQASYYRELGYGEAEELRRRANSRIGGGPTKFTVAGH